jgi:hypothetical protein
MRPIGPESEALAAGSRGELRPVAWIVHIGDAIHTIIKLNRAPIAALTDACFDILQWVRRNAHLRDDNVTQGKNGG